MNMPAELVVIAFGLFFIGLCATIWIKPAAAERFLLAFASSARAHFLEQGLRLLFGVALLLGAPAMNQGRYFALLGWVVIATTVGLLVLPWQWHQRFAQRVLPTVVRFKRLYGVALAGFGLLLLWGVRGP